MLSSNLIPQLSHRLYTGIVMALNLSQVFKIVAGTRFCENMTNCVDSGYIPYICPGDLCVCYPERGTSFISCVPVLIYGAKCRVNEDCHTADINLICAKADSISKTCRCRKELSWDFETHRCFREYEIFSDATHKFDPVRDYIIPGIIVMTIGAMMYLGIKLFCNCGKLWQRNGSHIEAPRELEDCIQTSHNATWVASYRVFSSLERSPSSQYAATHSSLHPPHCLLLPGSTTTMSPPSYEEALKHKIILSSYPVSLASVAPPPPPLPMILPPLPPQQQVPSSSRHQHSGS